MQRWVLLVFINFTEAMVSLNPDEMKPPQQERNLPLTFLSRASENMVGAIIYLLLFALLAGSIAGAGLSLYFALSRLWALAFGEAPASDLGWIWLSLFSFGAFAGLIYLFWKNGNENNEASGNSDEEDEEVEEVDHGEEFEVYGVPIYSGPYESLKASLKQSGNELELLDLALNLEDYPTSTAALALLGDDEFIAIPFPRDVAQVPDVSEENPFQFNYLAARIQLRLNPSLTLSWIITHWPWVGDPVMTQIIRDHRSILEERHPFIEEMHELSQILEGAPDKDSALNSFSEIFDDQEIKQLREALTMKDLEGVFEWWSEKSAEEQHQMRNSPLVGCQRDRLQSIGERFGMDNPRSLLISGEAGVGKKTIARAVLCHLQDQGWAVMESTAQDLISGTMFVGQMEDRWLKILSKLQNPKTILYIPDFAGMEHAGKHMQNPVGLLDRLNIEVNRNRITVLGVLEDTEMERMLRNNASLRKYFDIEKVAAPDAKSTCEILSHHVQQIQGETGVRTDAEVIEIIVELSSKFMHFQAALGGSFDLHGAMMRKILLNKKKDELVELTREDAIEEVCRFSGLPKVLVDEKEVLDPKEVGGFFKIHLFGKEEAMRCMGDRITLLKAGLTDTGRPLGVFFFAGPTGTGKTESAKVLAQYLFGSKERLLRIDMSELQSYEDLSRLFGSNRGMEGHHQRSLLDGIRNQPFSVVLLDEFEKAHPNVWDLFLQAFDDARMTDANGQTVCLKHVVFILTSNVGAREATQGSFGFKSAGVHENPYEIALKETFRPEFLNRIDQIVTFRPFSRAEQRALLELELERVLSRRGLKDRPWAVEWEESAIDLLLSHGLTADLGARPLRRSVERLALPPIASWMLVHENPQAYQFPAVRGEYGKNVVDFVDPDAAEQEAAEAELTPFPPLGEEAGQAPRLQIPYIAMKGAGRFEEVMVLADEVEQLERLVESEDWSKARESALKSMEVAGFWEDPDRLPILAQAELRDRIDNGTSTARSLLDRLSGSAETSRDHYPPALIQRLAQQIYLLDHAAKVLEKELPQDAYLRIQPVQRDRESADEQVSWCKQLQQMITEWADKRNMQLEELSHDPSGDWLVAVTGFGSWMFLNPLGGLHELEQPEAHHRDRKIHARISIAPLPLGLPPADRKERINHANSLLEDSPHKDEIVQRYRLNPDPKLVNLQQGWRFAQPIEALNGNFDLVASWASTRHPSESR